MPWLELRVETRPEKYQDIETALFDLGALSVTALDAKDSPIYEPDPDQPPIWPDPIVVGLFDAQIDQQTIYSQIQANFDLDKNKLHWNILEDKVWEKEWMQHFQPMCFGDNFWVYSEPVTNAEAGAEAKTLLLDPGLAFGTGTHPTTALCLEWVIQQDCTKKSVTDYGCGSGLLGIAALMRGASHAHFTDIDPQAITATQGNLHRNDLTSEQYQLFLAKDYTEQQVDIFLANILAGPLVELAELFSRLVKPRGYICLSGILNTQEESILDAYRPWFNNLCVTQSGDWLRITGQRSN